MWILGEKFRATKMCFPRLICVKNISRPLGLGKILWINSSDDVTSFSASDYQGRAFRIWALSVSCGLTRLEFADNLLFLHGLCRLKRQLWWQPNATHDLPLLLIRDAPLQGIESLRVWLFQEEFRGSGPECGPSINQRFNIVAFPRGAGCGVILLPRRGPRAFCSSIALPILILRLKS